MSPTLLRDLINNSMLPSARPLLLQALRHGQAMRAAALWGPRVHRVCRTAGVDTGDAQVSGCLLPVLREDPCSDAHTASATLPPWMHASATSSVLHRSHVGSSSTDRIGRGSRLSGPSCTAGDVWTPSARYRGRSVPRDVRRRGQRQGTVRMPSSTSTGTYVSTPCHRVGLAFATMLLLLL